MPKTKPRKKQPPTEKRARKANKSSKGEASMNVAITLYVPKRLKKSLEHAADEWSKQQGERVTVSRVVREALSWYFATGLLGSGDTLSDALGNTPKGTNGRLGA